MGIPCHVNTAIDITAGMLTHSLIPPPPAPPTKVPAVPSVEMIATQMWTLGFLCGQNKLTTTVLHYGLPMIQEGHDQGMMIPDVTIPPTNIWYAVMWPFSSRKVMFFSSLVHYNQKGAGCTALFLPFPMLTCGEPISAPTARPLTNLLNTVIVSLSPGDILLGIGRIAFSMALDYVFSKIGGGDAPTGSAWSQVGQEFLGKLCPTDPAGWAKLALSGLSGVFFPSPTDGPKFEMKIGMPGVAEGGVSISGSETSVGAGLFGGGDNQGGFGLGGSTGVKYGDSEGTRGFAAGNVGDSKGEVSTADSPSSSGSGAKGSGTGAKGGGGGGGSSSSGGGAKGTGGSGSQSSGGGGGGGTTLGGGGSSSSGSGAKGTSGGGGGSQSSGGGSSSQSSGGGSGGSKSSGGGGGSQSSGGGSGSQSSGGGSSSGTKSSSGGGGGSVSNDEEEELQM